MGRLRVWLVVASVVVGCLGDKDPTLQLRPPTNSGSQAPVYSSSVESIPVGSGSQQQNVYVKGQGISQASASASASNDGGRNNNQWYNGQNQPFAFDYNTAETGSAGSVSHAGGSSSGGYYEAGPHVTTQPGGGYAPANGPSHTYYYQHYPVQNQEGHGWSGGGGDDGGLFGGFGNGLDFPGFGGGGAGGGIAAAKVVKVVAIIAKGILALKPFLIIGLLLLIAIPVLLLLLPIPIITITGQPSNGRSGRSAQIKSYLTNLSAKVLNSEECLERIICKLPQPPEKYKPKAKLIWDEYGTKVVTNTRVARGLNAYFEPQQKNRNLKCDQRFKCTNKFL